LRLLLRLLKSPARTDPAGSGYPEVASALAAAAIGNRRRRVNEPGVDSDPDPGDQS